MLGEAKDEIKFAEDIWGSSEQESLRAQMDVDYGYWSPYDFKMNSREGSWRSMTTPMARTLGNKIKTLNQMASRNIKIDIIEEERQKNKRVAATERLAIGMINQADRENTRMPSGVSLQDSFAFYSAIHGGTAVSVLLTETDGKVKSNISSYDPYGCIFLEGDDGLIWFCYQEYLRKSYLERKYKKLFSDGFEFGDSDKTGKSLVLCRYIWDEDEWKLGINGEWVPDEGDQHRLGYLPVFVNPCGGVPSFQAEDENTYKHRWQSVYVNIRDLIPIESELLSIELTSAKQAAQVRGVATYDGSLTKGMPPEELQKLVQMAEGMGQKDNVVLLDTSKGVDWKGYVQQPDNQVAERLHNRLISYNSLSSIDPVTYGATQGGASGALANILRDAALEFNHPFAMNIEQKFVQISEEIVRQYKNNKFAQVEVVGKDSRANTFSEKIKPEDIEEHYFVCELVVDRLRDEAIEVGLAIQKVKAGLLDKKTALSNHNISADPDRTLEMIERERHAEMSANDPVYHNLELADYYHNEGNDQMAAYHKLLADGAAQLTVSALAMKISELMAPQPMGNQGVGGNGGVPVNPDIAGAAGRASAAPLTEQANSIESEIRG